MSETVYYTGKLKKVFEGTEDELEIFCKNYYKSINKEKSEYDETYLEAFEDDFYQDFVILNDILGSTIYKVVEMNNEDVYEDIFTASKNPNGTIDFTVKYYNGGCSLNEAIEEALARMEKK